MIRASRSRVVLVGGADWHIAICFLLPCSAACGCRPLNRWCSEAFSFFWGGFFIYLFFLNQHNSAQLCTADLLSTHVWQEGQKWSRNGTDVTPELKWVSAHLLCCFLPCAASHCLSNLNCLYHFRLRDRTPDGKAVNTSVTWVIKTCFLLYIRTLEKTSPYLLDAHATALVLFASW